MLVHCIIGYLKFSVCMGITFVIITSIETPCRYKNMKERVKTGLLMMLMWPIVLIYGVIQEVKRFKRRK